MLIKARYKCIKIIDFMNGNYFSKVEFETTDYEELTKNFEVLNA